MKHTMSVLNKAFAQNPEKFRCTDNDKIEWLFNFNAYKSASFVSKAWKKRQQGLFVQYCLLFMSLFWSSVVLFDPVFMFLFWHLVCLLFGVL